MENMEDDGLYFAVKSVPVVDNNISERRQRRRRGRVLKLFSRPRGWRSDLAVY